MKQVVLIGASTIDFIAKSKDRFILKNKNPGEIKISFGGVMRNVSYSLGLLKNKITFFTTLGNDLYGINNKEELENNNVSVIFPSTNKNSAIYLCLNDNDNDMICGLTDNSIFSDLTLDFILTNRNYIDNCDYLVIDGNLDESIIKNIFNIFNNKKIIVEAVSSTKVIKFINYLSKIYLLKCNAYEAKAILNNDSLKDFEILDEFNKRGIKNVVVTQGSDDILYLDNGINKRKEIEKQKNIVNTTGCGDALFAGLLHSLINEKSLDEGIKTGIKLANLTLYSESAVSKEIANLKDLL